MEALWPDEDPARLSNRLSVALSTVRTVLDPERRYASDRFVQADKHVVGLAHMPIDVEEFLTAATAGLDRFTSGERAEALALLASAETTYTGDFLEDDPYEDWALSLREEARAVYLAVARTLARSAAAAGDDLAVRYHLGVLERDAYDEEAHLGLVATWRRPPPRRRAVATGSTARRWTSWGSSPRHSRRRAAQRPRRIAAPSGHLRPR